MPASQMETRAATSVPVDPPATSLVGVIDIGSNSIRLVIYRGGGKLPHPQFNEREVCRLAEGVAETNRLDKTRISHALQVLRRFARLLKLSQVPQVHAFATEAVRRADNASDFINQAETILGVAVDVISGIEEARLSAYGVAGGFLKPKGVVADLGGGSLELIPINGAPLVKHATSLPCGYLIQLSAGDLASQLTDVAWLDTPLAQNQPLYAVGGAWRAVATAYCYNHKPRIDIAHGLELDGDTMHAMLARIADCDGDMRGIPPARRPTMQQAINISKAVLVRLNPSKVIFSSYGLREGVLFNRLAAATPSPDPLLDGVREYAEVGWRFAGLGSRLVKMLPPFIAHLDNASQRLAQATAYLADIAWLEHPDHRPRLALEKMLGLSVVGITHAERVWMAAALYTRYMGYMPKKKSFLSLLPKQQRRSAKYVGLLLRMLMTLSGGVAPVFDNLSVKAVTSKTKQKPILKLQVADDILGSGVLFARRLDEVNRYYPGVIRLC